MSPSKVSTVDFATFHNTVNGEHRGGKTVYQGINPATREQLWDTPVATKQDLDDAVSAAQQAFPAWSATSLEERREKVKGFADALRSYADELAELLMKEAGKPRMFAKMEAGGAPALLDYNAQCEIPVEKQSYDDKEIITRYIPMGIVGAICPWNFPIVLSVGKMAPALVTGNCIIVKPSPFTPYTALKIVEIGQQFFPPGVLQALGGDAQLGPQMTLHPGIQKISFTGSIATGKKVAEACAKTLKRVTLELGGNDASIVLPDVDIQKTAPEVITGAFFNSGQVCVASKRLYVHASIYNEFVAAMAAHAKNVLKIGPSFEEGVMLGPVQNEMQFDRVKGFFEDKDSKGYKYLTGGEVKKTKGYFVEPTIVDNPPDDSRIVVEEPFGPIVPVLKWTDEEEVIRRANDTNTGLGACVWSSDVDHAIKVAEKIEAGSVWINSFERPDFRAFFSGHKESGLGGEYGPRGLLAYCNTQAIHVNKK
ncbi:MAG: hypothetical protein M4579_003443 [Chaenotheca gracillima]|nr:MAG: hypothetical protein M4579_003443 [Chaenotheca gracillima]